MKFKGEGACLVLKHFVFILVYFTSIYLLIFIFMLYPNLKLAIYQLLILPSVLA